MLRAFAPYLFVCLLIAVLTGVLYGTGVFGMTEYYGSMLLTGVVYLAGCERWNARAGK